MGKYKLTWKDLTWHDFKTYLFAMFKAFIPKSKIKNLNQLEEFIQTKSAWVTQVTLYGYLKTLDRKIALNSVILKWGVVQKEFNERIKF